MLWNNNPNLPKMQDTTRAEPKMGKWEFFESSLQIPQFTLNLKIIQSFNSELNTALVFLCVTLRVKKLQG